MDNSSLLGWIFVIVMVVSFFKGCDEVATRDPWPDWAGPPPVNQYGEGF